MVMGQPLLLVYWYCKSIGDMYRDSSNTGSHPVLVLDLHHGVVNRKTDAIGLASGK